MEPLQDSLLRAPFAADVPRRPHDQGIERRFDVSFVARMALKEKQIQQNVRPVIAVHKWFARRPGTLFRALLLSEFCDEELEASFYRSHHLADLRIADPFMGGGTPLFEANRMGCAITGWDVNPMAYWIVRQEIGGLDLHRYRAEAAGIELELRAELEDLYLTTCTCCREQAPVKYFLWVKVHTCEGCSREVDLFPGYLVAADQRHPRNVLVCRCCGALTEVEDRQAPGSCSSCQAALIVDGPAGRGSCTCPDCGTRISYPTTSTGPPRHRMFALEYHCFRCKDGHQGRFFKQPDAQDLGRQAQAEATAAGLASDFTPDETIPPGDETERLHRWGYRQYRQMFNGRQLLGLSRLAEQISAVPEVRIRHALATNLSDLLRYQNMLCRYDTRSLKSLDVFSVHGFPVGLVQAESNLFGIQDPRTGRNVGSGGWSNVVQKFLRAKEYCDRPFEIRYSGRSKHVVPVPGEWIGDRLAMGGDSEGDRSGDRRSVTLHCGSAAEAELEEHTLDAVLTDPPYFANVQYAELMDFCYAWLRRIVGTDDPAFAEVGARRRGDLTGNRTLDRGLEHFVEGLSDIYCRLARALKPGRPFVFTYHHNSLDAYYPVAVALLDAGLICTASLPCPAEMGGSIHIHGSDSSIVDTVFVCRATGRIPAMLLGSDADSIAARVAEHLELLRDGGVKPTAGDARCITFGHLVRLAVWKLRGDWSRTASWTAKLVQVAQEIGNMPGWQEIAERIESPLTGASLGRTLGGDDPTVHDARIVF